MTAENQIGRARSALAATSVGDLDVAVLYASVARNAIAKAKEEIAALEQLLLAREQELLARGKPVPPQGGLGA